MEIETTQHAAKVLHAVFRLIRLVTGVERIASKCIPTVKNDLAFRRLNNLSPMKFKNLFWSAALAFLSLSSSSLGAQTPNSVEVTLDGSVERFERSPNRLYLLFDSNTSEEVQKRLIEQSPYFLPLGPDAFLKAPKGVLVETRPGVDPDQALKAIERWNELRFASRGLVYSDGVEQFPLPAVHVQLKSPQALEELRSIAQQQGTELKTGFLDRHYVIDLDKTTSSPLALAAELSKNEDFAFAEPDFLRLLKPFSTNDPALSLQWALNNTGSAAQYSGTPGADMDVFRAWTCGTGSSNIKVAIIDEGVDLAHPDMVGKMLPGFDGTGLGSNGGPSNDDAHGTACAGIVAANGNNSLGSVGVAYGVKIIPVRIGYSNAFGNWITTDAGIGSSITWAWQTAGADILSNSWGGGSPTSLISTPCQNAVSSGRSGLGAPVLFAAGNGNGSVHYPATLTEVIAVAATSMCDQRKSPSSCDGETWWGSDFGTSLDIAAPGVKIYTTDISGGTGYDAGDYFATFNGTSSATPNAAGVMALILSKYPGISGANARMLIEQSCEKVGGYAYGPNAVQPTGTWSTDLGYGRVNAYAACKGAEAMLNNTVAVVTHPINVSGALCPNSTVLVPYSAMGVFNANNVFTVQLSDANGSFANPVAIANVLSTQGGVISASIPANTPVGSGYRIRVVSSSPAAIGNDNGNNLALSGFCLETSNPSSLQWCIGSVVTIPFTVQGTMNPGNTFSLQLSNASGSFTSPTVLATQAGTTSGSFSYTVSASIPAGTGYLLRVVASNPAAVGTPNPAPITVYSVCPYCFTGTLLTAPSGTFSDGSGANQYFNFANCDWLIQPPGASSITLSFSFFDTESGYDYVRIYDGTNTASPLLGQFSGSTLPAAVTSTGGSMFVVFTSDNIITDNGWTANYTSIPLAIATTVAGAPPCNSVAANPIVVNYTVAAGAYDAGNVFTAQLSDQLGSFANPLAIGSTTSTASGSINASIPFDLIQGSNYQIRVVASNPPFTGDTAAVTSNCLACIPNLALTAQADTFADGSGMVDYVDNLVCSWLIVPSNPNTQSIQLHFSDFDTEQYYDLVRVYDGVNNSAPLLGEFNGNTLPPMVSSTSTILFVEFTTDVSVTRPGWTAYYSTTLANPCPSPIVAQTTVVKAPFCAGDLATVKVGYSGGSGPKSILWSTGATSKFITVPAGTYTVTVSDALCSATDTVVVTNPANSDMSVTGVVVTKNGPQIFNVSWAAPAPVAGKTIIGYRVAYRLRGTTTFNQLPLTTNLTASVNFTGLGLCNGNYDFTVYTRFSNSGTPTTSAPACFVSRGYNGGSCKAAEFVEGEEYADFDFTLYPNPTQGIVYVEAPAGTTLEVYDLRGSKLLDAAVENGSHTLDLSSYAKGVYLLRLQSGDLVETQRIMRE